MTSQPDDAGGSGSFEERLRAAETRRGKTGPEPTETSPAPHGEASALGISLRVGVELVSALGIAVAIGWVLDHWLHTTPVLLGVFVLVGGAAGVLNVWRLMGPRAPKR